MNDVLRIARLKIALQRAFLGRAILIFTIHNLKDRQERGAINFTRDGYELIHHQFHQYMAHLYQCRSWEECWKGLGCGRGGGEGGGDGVDWQGAVLRTCAWTSTWVTGFQWWAGVIDLIRNATEGSCPTDELWQWSRRHQSGDWYSGEESCVDFRGKNLSETKEFHSGEMESQVLESWLEGNLEYCEWVFAICSSVNFLKRCKSQDKANS